MNGIFSATPAAGPIRLLVGTHGLMLVQLLLALQLPTVAGGHRALITFTLIIALMGLLAAACGETRDSGQQWWRRRHGR
ncbi:MAG: hypothetical protein ACTHOJ_18010 [Sphingomonas oligoaromativorans]